MTDADSTPRAMPHGVFDLVGAGSKIDPAAITNPSVDGISLRQHWVELERREGVFNFAYFDAEIARASAAGKQLSIRVPTGGDEMPAWVTAAIRSAGDNTFTFTISNGQQYYSSLLEPDLPGQEERSDGCVGGAVSQPSGGEKCGGDLREHDDGGLEHSARHQ